MERSFHIQKEKIQFIHFNRFTKKHETEILEDFSLPLIGDKKSQKNANMEMVAYSNLIHMALRTGKNPVNLVDNMIQCYWTNVHEETFKEVGYSDTSAREALYDFVIRCCECCEMDHDDAIQIWNIAYNKTL